MERERNIAKESCQNSFSNDGIRSLPWKFVFFSLIRVSNLFFLLLSRTSISERLKSVCTFESRDLSFFFFLFETRERRVGVKIPRGRKEGGFFFSYRRG